MSRQERPIVTARILPPSVVVQREGQTSLEKKTLPPRSRLYGMAPCGEGIWSESLTSYINRLARLHSVPPQHLVVREIVPQMSQSTSHCPLFISQRSTGVSINGNGPLAREWSDILERLTKRTDLHFLTLQWWVGDLPSHKLLREKPAWCPACYAEWKGQGVPIYEPLLWRISTVTICPLSMMIPFSKPRFPQRGGGRQRWYQELACV